MNNKRLHVLKTAIGLIGCLVSAVMIWLLVDFSM